MVKEADDEHVNAATGAAHAESIAIRDRKHLLPVGTRQGIDIVTARVVVDRLAARRRT